MAVDISASDAASYTVLLVGFAVCWRYQFSATTAHLRVCRLAPWNISSPIFVQICLQGMLGGIVGGAAARGVFACLPQAIQDDTNFAGMVISLGLHFGVLAAAFISRNQATSLSIDSPPTQVVPAHPPISTKAAIGAGFLTFLAALALLTVVGLAWQELLHRCGVPAEKQPLLDLFGQTHEPFKLALMIFVAVVIAPITEELTFRAGLFRYLRTRLPSGLAYVLPAAVFAVLHNNLSVFVPLLTLGVLFSVVYRRTGRVLVTVIAHGLFNLNTIILIFAGINT